MKKLIKEVKHIVSKAIKIHWKLFEMIESKKAKKRIKNTDFTIISSNCCSGWIYKLLGMRFDSPTINLWIDKKEFILFASDLHYYLAQKLKFYKKEGRTCPCAYIGEDNRKISIDFIHYETEEIAEKKWIERKKRIHWDNLYIITCDDDKVKDEDFKLLDNANCKRKIVFTAVDRAIKDSFTLHTIRKRNSAAYMQVDRNPITGYRPYEREFDFVAWFNGENDFRKK